MTYPTTNRGGRIIFIGNFWAYWSLKYFFTRLEIEIETQ